MYLAIIDLMKDLFVVGREGSKRVRAMIGVAIIITMASIILAFSGQFFGFYMRKIIELIAIVCGTIAGGLALGIIAYKRSAEETRREERIHEVERRVQQNPKETQTAWELARIKLETYLNRNLNQVRSILWLVLFVMLIGNFGIVEQLWMI
jgi:hypothetical protein